MKKLMALSFMLLLFSFQLSAVFADTEINREKAIQMAIESSEAKEELDDTLTNLHAQMAQLYQYAKQQANGKDNYDAMVEQMKAFGIPLSDEMVYTAEESYNYFYSMQIQYESLNAQYLALKDTYDNIDIQLIAGVDTLYTNLLYLREMTNIQNDYIAIQTTLQESSKTQYDLGLLSKNEYEDVKANYLKALYQRSQLQYDYENLELQFKQLLGLEMDDNLLLSDSYLSPNVQIETLAYYEELAAENRIDIKSGQYQLDASENIYDYNMHALYDRMNQFKAQMAIDQAEANLNTLKVNVYKDVLGAYQDVIDAQNTVKVAQKQYEIDQATLRQADVSLAQGLIKQTDYDLVKYAKTLSEASLKSDIRKLFLAIETLNNKTVVE
jgi:outer membrane protein TolC